MTVNTRSSSAFRRTGATLRLASACMVATAALAMGGCASNPTNAQIGTGVGAVVGGVAGNAVFGGPLGTIGGAAAGALIGHELGEDRDQRRPQRRR